MFFRRLKDVTKKTSFLRYIWDVLKTSQKIHFFWDVTKRSLRCLSQWRSGWDLTETCHAGWVCTAPRKRFISLVFLAVPQEIFLRRLRYVTEKISFLRYARDILKTSQKRYGIFFEMYLKGLKDVTKMSSLVRCF